MQKLDIDQLVEDLLFQLRRLLGRNGTTTGSELRFGANDICVQLAARDLDALALGQDSFPKQVGGFRIGLGRGGWGGLRRLGGADRPGRQHRNGDQRD